jgi:hypothetical protein
LAPEAILRALKEQGDHVLEHGYFASWGVLCVQVDRSGKSLLVPAPECIRAALVLVSCPATFGYLDYYHTHPYSFYNALSSEPAIIVKPFSQSAAMISGGNGTRAQKCYYKNRNTHRSITNSPPNRATIESRLSSGAIALTANESLKMKTLEDSIYKDFASVKVACHLATVF